MNEIPNHPVYSKNVLEFITVVNDFCLMMPKVGTLSKSSLIDYLQKVCPLLYVKASLLPAIEIENPEANERFVTEEEWESLFNELRKKFSKDDEFWYIDNSTEHNDSVKASLAESFTDIYHDLKDFLLLYQRNSIDAKENAVGEVKLAFEKRWGFRLVNAHKALHYLIMTGNIQDNSLEVPELF